MRELTKPPWYNVAGDERRDTMQSALRKSITVQYGGRVEFLVPELAEGTTAEVILIVDADSETPETSLSALIGLAKGCYSSSSEADEFIRQERDAWHS